MPGPARFLVLCALLGAAACRPTYPGCGRDEDCLGSELCVRGQCQQCRDDGDCADGQRCEGGRCESRPDRCATDVECGAGARCRDGRCVDPGPVGASQPPPADCALAPVPFAFDDATLSAEAREVVADDAACLAASGATGVWLVGHADARGTEEYNLALGERRAEAVRAYLVSFGVDAGSVQVQSMGEELASGTDEAGFARDRRVDLEARPALPPEEAP